MRHLALVVLGLILFSSSVLGLTSKDAYVLRKGDSWTLGTAKVERTLNLASGKFFTASWKDKTSGRELIPASTISEELAVVVDGQPVSGSSGGWKLVEAADHVLAQGEIQLDITLQCEALEATKSYLVYPGSSVIREWVRFKNVGARPRRLSEPRFLSFTTKSRPPETTDFYWMTGGENRAGSWVLKTEKLSPGKTREFDSYDPFGGTAEGNFLGDGVLARVLVNDRQVWPVTDGHDPNWAFVSYGWTAIANSTVRVPLRAPLELKAGDKVRFVLNRNGTTTNDATVLDPTIAYADNEVHTASKEFSREQGEAGWRYQMIAEGEFYESKAGQFQDLVYDDATQRWAKPSEKGEDSLFISAGQLHPGKAEDVVLVWTAPKSGHVAITADLTNVGNPPVPGGGRNFRMGTSSYAPWYALMSTQTGQGVFMGLDYFGRWASQFTQGENGAISGQFRVAGYDTALQPSESVITPQGFVGLFQKDLDNAGNECLDWQYAYLWDYTRPVWFPAIRMLGWWMKGTGWGEPGSGWTGSTIDTASTFRKVFRVADLMREVGADVYHRDWGWWDRAGDWNGPDFKTMGAYLRKNSMGQLIYAFLYTVDPKSQVATEHPDWVADGTLDMSKPEVVEFIKNQLDQFRGRFGPFEWRNDSVMTVQRNGDTMLLGQDQGLREIFRSFLDKHPDCAFQGVNGGGNYTGYDYARYASSISFSDGAVGIIRNQWASLILPPDKTSDIPDIWQPDKFDKAIWRGLLTINFDMTGDTWNPQKLEGIRELIDIYHYLASQGVVGRWVHVYRPQVTGEEPAMYFERLSRDGKRGIIIPKRQALNAVTIKPKGLNASENYVVSFQESKSKAMRTGADLMANGITIEKMEPGELIYLNLPYHPGNTLDKVPPTPPSNVRKAAASNMGFPGVELTWSAGKDDHWLSYYEVLRNGQLVDKVAKGTFYFDHSAGADIAATYQIRSVDGASLRSTLATAAGPGGKLAVILDDAQSAISYAGNWQREKDLQPAYQGTISHSDEKGASFSFDAEGAKFTWFTKLGEDCGKAEISIDGQREAVVDTYSADDIWGVGIYSKVLATPGKHTVKITVLGERSGSRGKGTQVYLDGVRIEGRE